MGFELGPGFQRSPPRGWIPARAFARKRELLPPSADENGSGQGEIDTSHRFWLTWEVQAPDGRTLAEFSEERTVPAWVYSLSPSGKRWYKPRLRPSYGLVASLGVPGFVDPDDPRRMWLNWDASYDEHVEAWEQRGRVDRAIAERDNAYDRVFHRVFNPLQGKLREGEEALVEAEIEARAEQAEATRQHYIELAEQQHGGPFQFTPAKGADGAELSERTARAERLHAEGRPAAAVLVEKRETGRTVAGMPVFEFVLDVTEDGQTRRVVYEHLWGKRHAKHYRPGRNLTVRVDPADPAIVELA